MGTPLPCSALHTRSTLLAIPASAIAEPDTCIASRPKVSSAAMVASSAVELRRGGKNDVVNEVSAAVVVVADERRSGRHAFDDAYELGLDAVLNQALKHDFAKRVVADRADEYAASADLRGLINKDSRRAGRIGTGIGAGTLMPSVARRRDQLDQQIADAPHSRETAHVPSPQNLALLINPPRIPFAAGVETEC